MQGPPRVLRGQFKCAESSEGAQEPGSEQGPATMCGVLNEWPRYWLDNNRSNPGLLVDSYGVMPFSTSPLISFDSR